MLARGDKVRDYEIIAPIRSGGMAMLYLARRRGVGGFSRLVALKLVHSHLADDESINRLFLQEARIAASVAHPNVVNVEEVGKADGNYFIAMEYVHGVSLAELLASLPKRRLRMSPKLCVWVAAQVSEALHAAHEAAGEDGAPLHIVHRDVSPQNVLIGHTGHVKLIDFGIAKSQPLSHHGSSGGSVLGKLGYMAPEQLRIHPLDRRTDVYALGVILWEMLTSRSLLRCIRVDDERDWATREVPPPPSRHASNLAPALDRAVLKAIAFDPNDRYDDALGLRAALLRAEPSAAQVDAPMFAALMRTMLGEELERKRASWPREVNVQLDSAAESTTDHVLNLEELTARLRSSELPGPPDEEVGEELPTLKESPAALRRDRVSDASELGRALGETEIAAPRAPSIEAHIVTLSAPASTARPLSRLELALRNRTLYMGALGSLLFVFATILGATAGGPASGFDRGLVHQTPSSTGVARSAPSVRSLSQGSAAVPVAPSAQAAPPPLKLDETQIVSSAPEVTDARREVRQASPVAQGAKRSALGARDAAPRAKGKAAVAGKNKKLRRP